MELAENHFVPTCKNRVLMKVIFHNLGRFLGDFGTGSTSTTPLQLTDPGKKMRGDSVPGVAVPHKLPKMDFRYFHSFSQDRNTPVYHKT